MAETTVAGGATGVITMGVEEMAATTGEAVGAEIKVEVTKAIRAGTAVGETAGTMVTITQVAVTTTRTGITEAPIIMVEITPIIAAETATVGGTKTMDHPAVETQAGTTTAGVAPGDLVAARAGIVGRTDRALGVNRPS